MDTEKYYHIRYPKTRNGFLLYQEYAASAYLILFFGLGILIYLRLGSGESVLLTGLAGALVVVLAGHFAAWVKMRNTFVELGFTGDRFYIQNVHDLLNQHEPLWFPLMYASPRREGENLLVHYYGRVITLNLAEWDNPGEILRHYRRMTNM